MSNFAWRCSIVTREKRLGRGLESLLSVSADGPAPGHSGGPHMHVPRIAEVEQPTGEQLVELSVYEVDSNPYQPRAEFDEGELSALADSIREHGMLQPILVRQVGGRYQLIAGERRLKAAIRAGWTEVPARVREADDREMAELAIVENLQRKDLNPLEKAASFQQYLEQYGVTQEELAGRLKIDRSTIANLIRLLELPRDVQGALRSGQITQGHARALLPLGDERTQIEFMQRIREEGLSVRATENLVQETIHYDDRPQFVGVIGAEGTPPRGKSPKRTKSGQIAALEQEFRAALGSKVDVRQTSAGRGKIVIHFKNHDEFERLRDYLVGQEPEAHSRAG
ncbi:MAG: ParB/RepB/Spo0J family partition protein [Pirellulales bacterium]|nr:ParB/RepB/Spo0J family partition protein [Pirellulales bacterium]